MPPAVGDCHKLGDAGHLHGSVTGQGHQRLVWMGQLGRDAVGEGTPHAGQGPGKVRRNTRRKHQLAGIPVNATADVDINWASAGSRPFSSRTTRSGLTGLAGHGRAFLRQGAPADHFLFDVVRHCPRGRAVQPGDERLEGSGGVASQSDLNGVAVADLPLVDVDLHRAGGTGRGIKLGPGVV